MAAAGSRTLKLSLLADVAEFTKGINTASKNTESIGDQFTAFGKKAALAFAAAGAAIGAFAVESIKNAAADEKAQRLLALTIEKTTTATSEQIAGVEKYISTTSVAIGVTDDELRPAFSRLVRSTKDVEDAQKLLSLALDVSAATGKPLETISNALGKAYDGNLNSLGKLGLGIDSSILKSKDFNKVFNTLTDTFGGFADNEAQSAEKAFERIKIATDEVKEQIGAALLPAVAKLTSYILTNVVPGVQSFVNGLTGQNGLTEGLTESEIKAVAWGKKVRSIIDTVISLKQELIIVGAVIAGVFAVQKISAAVVATIALINTLIKAYNVLKASSIVAGVASAFALNPLLGVGAVALAAAVLSGANALANKSNTSAATVGAAGFSGTMPNGQPFSDGDFTAPVTGKNVIDQSEDPFNVLKYSTDPVARAKANAQLNTGMFNTGGINDAANSARTAAESLANTASAFATTSAFDNNGTTINLNVNGAIDSEGTARAIIDALNNSFYRGTNGATNLVTA
jgi:hypothetical protein